MYAYFTPQVYNVTFSGDKVSFSSNPLKVSYISSSQITLTPASGYYFESISCSTGYTVTGFSSGTSYYSTQTITITNNTYVGGGTCTVKMHARSYPATATYNPKTCHRDTTVTCNNPHSCTMSGESTNCTYDCSNGSTMTACKSRPCPECPDGWTGYGDSFSTTIKESYNCSYYTYSCPQGGTLNNSTKICEF